MHYNVQNALSNLQLDNLIQGNTNVLEQLKLEKEKERKKALEKRSDPNDPTNIPKLANLWMQRCVGKFIKLVYASMIGYVSLPAILDLTAKKYKRDELGHFKESMLDIMDKSGYELILYKSIKTLLNKDAFWLYCTYYQNVKKGVRPLSHICSICDDTLLDR